MGQLTTCMLWWLWHITAKWPSNSDKNIAAVYSQAQLLWLLMLQHCAHNRAADLLHNVMHCMPVILPRPCLMPLDWCNPL